MKTDFVIDDHHLQQLVTYYGSYREENDDPRILYTFKSDDFRVTVYQTKKVLFQGVKAYEEYLKWAKLLGKEVVEPMVTQSYDNDYVKERIIGSDEVGTGDFFGPIVVCAAYVRPSDISMLNDLDVRDSKTMTDEAIIRLGEQLIEAIPYHVLVLSPEKYNQLTGEGYNMNKIKAYLHDHAIKKMVEKHSDVQRVIVDQFTTPESYFRYLSDIQPFRKITFHTKAESIHRSVACASIIARYKFLLEMEKLSKEIDIHLPKGSGAPVDAIAKVILLKHGAHVFKNIAKINFKNMERINP